MNKPWSRFTEEQKAHKRELNQRYYQRRGRVLKAKKRELWHLCKVLRGVQ